MSGSGGPGTRSEATPSGLGAWYPFLVVVLLCLVALAPLLRPDTPCTHDGGLHYHRVVALARVVRSGVPFTRYLPDLAFGYGYPFFNYREPGSYYLTLALYLAGLPLPVALNLVYATSILGCALGAYLLARDLFGPEAGIVAAVAYAYAPYQFIDALLRGNAPESVALALLPFILWAFRRLALTGRRRYFAVSTGCLVALFLTHYISSLIFTPLLVAYLAALWLIHRARFRWSAVSLALVASFGLAAFSVGPALLEQRYVQLHMSRVTRNNDFHYNFLGLSEIFAPPVPVDTSLMNPPMRIHLGLLLAVLGGIGLAVGWVRSRDRERRATLAFLVLAAAVMLWMSTRGSLWLWERAPLLPFVQFPWRFVGRATLPLAIVASTTFARTPLRPRRSRRAMTHSPFLLSLIAISLVILAALPDTLPPQGYCPAAPFPTIDDLFAYEHRSGLVGVDPEGSYFPVWVAARPAASVLEAQYTAGDPVARFDGTALPEGARITEAEYGLNRARVLVQSPTPFRARYLAFYFPGWQVTVDGQPITLTPSSPEGLITFDVPAGRHTVVVRFGETPLRRAFDALSIVSLAALVLGILGPVRLPGFVYGGAAPTQRASASARPLLRGSVMTVLAILLLVLKLGLVDRSETIFRRPALRADGTLPGVEQQLHQRYADGLTLIGYSRDRRSIPADGVLRIDLYWTAYARPSARYQSVIHLVGDDGLRWSMPDSFRPRGYTDHPSTKKWRSDRYALDSHEVEPLIGAPPGAYDVVLTVFARDTLLPLSVLDQHDQPAAPELTLGEITLSDPTHPADPETIGLRRHLDAPLGPLTLLGAHLDRDEAQPGDATLLAVYWRADRYPEDDLTLRVMLLAPDGSSAAVYSLPPTTAWHPTSRWNPGDVWLGHHVLHLPATLPSGTYRWRLALDPAQGSADLPAAISITAPRRNFSPPPVRQPVGTTLGNLATLVGFDLSSDALRPGEVLTVTLVWRAERTASTSYHVFLHLLDPTERVVRQSDGVPAAWTRPTTGWLAGEYVTDERGLQLPDGTEASDYRLSAGLYVPGGERLAAVDGTETIDLTTIVVEPR